MEKKTILKGMWWVKGNEDRKFVGILTYGAGYVPTLEIFPKEYEFGKQFVPDKSTIYGDAFGESQKIQAVTLLKCTSQNSFGRFTVGSYIYKHEFVYADCVAIGMLLEDDEIEQVQSPQNINLTCPGLDEYSLAHAVDHVFKDNIPEGRAYRLSDLVRIEFTQPDPIVIEIDIGTITVSLGHSSSGRDLSSHYGIHISLANPTPQVEVNSLIYSQFLSFLSIMTGRREYIETHSITINSNQLGADTVSIELNYGHIAHSTLERDYTMLDSLLLGRESNMQNFVTLFPKWRENFAFVEDLAFHYLEMADQATETNILQAFPQIETYVLERLSKKNMKSMSNILSKVINSNADYFQCSKVYDRHFPMARRDHIANQLANFRIKRTHPKSNKVCTFSSQQVYSYIDVILRSIFLKEMEYSYTDTDNVIGHWRSWHRIAED